ncbi:hypothetical protein J6590_030922 [Homalodisca vitripennis]|nr:hypothetical protein J6590_030922 [Homalodisca vitripennis]
MEDGEQIDLGRNAIIGPEVEHPSHRHGNANGIKRRSSIRSRDSENEVNFPDAWLTGSGFDRLLTPTLSNKKGSDNNARLFNYYRNGINRVEPFEPQCIAAPRRARGSYCELDSMCQCQLVPNVDLQLPPQLYGSVTCISCPALGTLMNFVLSIIIVYDSSNKEY